MQEPRSILCIHLNQIGDLLFSLPALFNVRARFPDAHIASVVRPICADLLSRADVVNEIVPRPKGGILSDLRLALALRRRRFDLLLLFSTSSATWSMAQLSGARMKAGFVDSMGGFLLDVVSPWSPPPSTKNNLQLAASIGCELIKKDYVGLLHTDEQDVREAERLLNAAGVRGDFAVMSAGASGGREIKCWSNEGFAGTADALHRMYGMQSIVVGVGGGSAISSLTEDAVDLTGRTSLPVLAAVLEKSSLFVGIDSGIMHLAAVMRVPVVGLFGPSSPEFTPPQGAGHQIVRTGIDCSPCFKSACPNPRCMNEIDVDTVVASVSFLMEKKNG